MKDLIGEISLKLGNLESIINRLNSGSNVPLDLFSNIYGQIHTALRSTQLNAKAKQPLEGRLEVVIAAYKYIHSREGEEAEYFSSFAKKYTSNKEAIPDTAKPTYESMIKEGNAKFETNQKVNLSYMDFERTEMMVRLPAVSRRINEIKQHTVTGQGSSKAYLLLAYNGNGSVQLTHYSDKAALEAELTMGLRKTPNAEFAVCTVAADKKLGYVTKAEIETLLR